MNYNYELFEKIDFIRQTILRLKKPSYSTTSKKEIRVRCPYCGDSKNNKSNAHLYIEMNPPFRFHCFKCETAGRLTQTTLRDFDLLDPQLTIAILEANKDSNIGPINISQFQIEKSFKFSVVDDNLTYRTTEYFNNRYETNLTPEYITTKFKAILNPPAFFNENKLIAPHNYFDFSNAIGFMSSDKSHIVFRDITGNQDRRYCNFALPGNNSDIVSKIYNISGNISALADSVKLVITEGIFDIIGVYLHFYSGKPENSTIFAASCGKSYNSVISHFIKLGFLNLEVEIYSDSDVGVGFFKSLKENSPYIKNNKITIYYNTLEKDFGIPKNRIQLRKAII